MSTLADADAISVQVVNPETPFGGVTVEIPGMPITQIELVSNPATVDSVFGRQGDVIAQQSDYSAFYAPLGGELPLGGTLNQVLTKNSSTAFDATWQDPSSGTPANPTASVGLTAVNGSGTNYMRANAAPALDVSIAPTWSGIHTFTLSPIVPTPTTNFQAATKKYVDDNIGLEVPSTRTLTIGGTALDLSADRAWTTDTILGLSANGLVKRTAANTYTNDASVYLTGNQTITLTGDTTGSGATAITTTTSSLTGPVSAVSTVANTNSVAAIYTSFVNSSGTAATGFGQKFNFDLEDSTTNNVAAGNFSYSWSDATHASRTSAFALQLVNNASAIANVLTISGAGNGVFTGTVLGSNLSGTNTGNVTLSGENYLSISSQVITAAAVNLSGTNATGTLAAGRFPALTGFVTTSAGSLATSVQTDAALTGNPTTTTQASTDNSTRIATTAYVTTGIANAVAGVNPAVATQAATTAAGDTSAFTYSNGVGGIGATLTGPTANTAVTIDGYTFTAVNQRLLVKNDTQSPSGAFNGVYFLSTLQAPAIKPVFTRALDYDQSSDINNTGAIPVVNGTSNADTSWLLTSTVTTVGTDPLTYVQFSIAPTNLVQTSRTLTIGGTAQDLSADRSWLGSVTNDAQTKASIVPNTAPSAGQILAGNAGGTAYAPVTLSGSGATATLSSAGVLTLSAIPLTTLAASTSLAIGVGTIELGHATDTTIARSGAGAITVEGVQVILSGAALGTPASGTLTNCTGLPIAGLTASTSTAIGVGTIELGHATDTTIARSGAGAITVEGVQVILSGAALGTPASGTLTNCTIPDSTTRTHDLTAIPVETGGWTEYFVTTSDATNLTTTLADITGLVSGTLSNSTKYEIEARLVASSSSAAGIEFAVHGAGTGSAATCQVWATGMSTTGIASAQACITAVDTATAAFATVGAGTLGPYFFSGFVTTTSTGTATISLQHVKVTSGTSTVKVGSVMRVRKAHT